MVIAEANGASVALDAVPEILQAGKQCTTPSLTEIIEEKTRENGRLRGELAYLQQVRQLGESLREEVDYVCERLRFALLTFMKGKEDASRSNLGL